MVNGKKEMLFPRFHETCMTMTMTKTMTKTMK